MERGILKEDCEDNKRGMRMGIENIDLGEAFE